MKRWTVNYRPGQEGADCRSFRRYTEKGWEGDSGLWTSTGRGRHRLRAPSWGTWLWEHSGAGMPKRLWDWNSQRCFRLQSVRSRFIRKHTLNVLSGDIYLPAVISAAGGRRKYLNAGGTAGIYDYDSINPVPEYVTVFRDGIFLFLNILTGIKTITF